MSSCSSASSAVRARAWSSRSSSVSGLAAVHRLAAAFEPVVEAGQGEVVVRGETLLAEGVEPLAEVAQAVEQRAGVRVRRGRREEGGEGEGVESASTLE